MQENRYSPSKSVLEDVPHSETLETCPPQVTAAIKLWVASYCFGLLMFAWEWVSTRSRYGCCSFPRLGIGLFGPIVEMPLSPIVEARLQSVAEIVL